jgi:hypothetical protein
MYDVLNNILINHESGHHTLPLLEAAKNSDVKLADILLRYGANVNSALPNGDTAFKVALCLYHFGFIQLFRKFGAIEPDVETTPKRRWYEAYKKQAHIMIEFEQIWWHLIGDTSVCGGQEGADRIRELLSNCTTSRVMVNLSLPEGWIALHYAAVHGNTNNADVLIQYGASLWFKCGQRPSGQESVLEVALNHQRQHFVEFLLKMGLDADYLQKDDRKEEIRKLATSIQPKLFEWDKSVPHE